jgi:protein-tyrosine-phosphatase
MIWVKIPWITDNDFYQFDLIVSLERQVYDVLEEIQPPDSPATLCEFVPDMDIDNPWRKPYKQFVRMYDQIERGMKPFIQNHIPVNLRK